MKAINNQKRAAGVNMKLLREKKNTYEGNSEKMTELRKKRHEKLKSKKREDSQLLQATLKDTQISTASMGIYDKKATKDEKNLGKRKTKKNVNLNQSEEKDRSLRMLKILKRKDEIKYGVVDGDAMMRKNQAANDNMKSKAKKRVKR
jgi:hypothetical protein